MFTKSPTARIAVAAASLALVLALVPVALAAKGGGSKGGGGTSGSGMTLTGVVTSTTFSVSGAGFKPGQIVNLSIGEANGCCTATNIFADSSGQFTYTDSLVGSGTYFVDASVPSGRGWTVVAHWSTQVP